MRGATLQAIWPRISMTVRSKTIRSTVIMSIGMGLRLLSQTVSFLIVSRFMGAAEFGAFISVAALVSIIAAFSGWGADLLILRTVARMPSGFAQAWGSGLAFLGVSALPLAVVAMLVVPSFIKGSVPRELVYYVVIADIIFAPIVSIGFGCYRAVDRPMGAALLYVGTTTTRLVAALLWVGLGSYDARSWARYYCGASVAFALISLLLVCRDLGMPEWKVRSNEWRDGFQFSLLTASGIASGAIVTPVVALLSDLPTAGIYGATMRVVEAAVIPFYAFMFSVLPRFFRSGASSEHDSLKLAVRMLPAALVATLLGSLCVVVLAPIAPIFLGHSYTGTGRAMMLLAPFPVLSGLYLLAADVLVSSRHAGFRVLLQCLMPMINIVLCILLVPYYGAIGAAIAVLISYTIMAVAAWTLAIIVSH
jgi:O-antigen/teichoic acid export membrane protein